MAAIRLALPGLFLALAGCGGDDSGGKTPPISAPSPAPTPAPTPTPTPTPSPTAEVTYLHVFGIDPSDGQQPNGPLLQASDGNLYGTTRAGGTGGQCFELENFCGVIFKVAPDGTQSVVYRFGGGPSDGGTPTGPLIQGRDGALYGMTTSGGAHNLGTAFKLTPDGTYTLLHSFGASPLAGDRPDGRLLEASDGNFYGTTIGGGPHDCAELGGDCGTVFRMTPTGEHTVLYSFGSRPGDGIGPGGSLIEGDDGNLYGTTSVGGNLGCSAFPNIKGCGTVFKITPAGAVTILHSFGSSSTDGILPSGPLIRGDDGAFYGTTYGGGGGACPGDTAGCGTVFRITPAGVISVVYAFSKPTSDGTTSYADGYNPTPFLIRGRDGAFYGTTEFGGLTQTRGTGTLFRLTASGVKTTLHMFGALNEEPSNPVGGLVEASDGAFYGVTFYNGKLGATGDRTGAGTVFKMVLP